MFDVNKFGANISRLRKEADMTQSEVADQLNVTRQAVSRYENGDSFPDVSIIVKISEVFGVSLDDLIGAGIPTKSEASILKSVVKDGEIPPELLDGGLSEIANIASLIKPSVLDRAISGLSHHGVDISSISTLLEYFNDKSVMKMLETANYDTLDEDIVEKFMPFVDNASKVNLLARIIDGELDYHFLRILVPYMEWFPDSLIEAAVVEGAIHEDALKVLHDARSNSNNSVGIYIY